MTSQELGKAITELTERFPSAVFVLVVLDPPESTAHLMTAANITDVELPRVMLQIAAERAFVDGVTVFVDTATGIRRIPPSRGEHIY